MTATELRDAQQEDPTLAIARGVAEGNKDLSGGEGFYYQDGLLYRHWEPKGQVHGAGSFEQIVLPLKTRDAVVAIAHKIPLSGHFGKTKTTQ